MFVLAEYEYKQKFEHIFQLYSGGLIFLNDKGIILDANKQIEKIIQMSRTQLCGMNALHLLEMVNETFVNKKAFLTTLLRDGHAELVSEIKIPFGAVKYIRIVVSKQQDTQLYLMEVHDDSDKMKMKKRLDHTESLSTLGQLAASIAHEIRNPMTSLKGFTQLLYKTATEDGKRYLSVIDDELKRMEEILTEFLEVSKPTINKYSSLDVKELIEEVVNFMAPKSLMQNINIMINPSTNNIYIMGDKQLLKQVFINAIKNAIESMPMGGNIVVDISHNVKDNAACIAIEDNGQGIEESILERIFEPFYTTKTSGTGLGLSHIYSVIEAHGGTIEVSSVVEKGTIFKFHVPLQMIM